MKELSIEEMTTLGGGFFNITGAFNHAGNGDGVTIGNGVANRSGGIANDRGNLEVNSNNFSDRLDGPKFPVHIVAWHQHIPIA
jgi:hypothetical protein